MKRSMTAGCLAVAVMNFVFMVAELMAGRLAAPWVGVSSYTWVSLTVAALAGCAAGNALADALRARVPPWRTVAAACLAAGLLLFFSGAVNRALGAALAGLPLGVAARAFLHMTGLFFLPALVMGFGTPNVLAAVVRDGHSGRGIGAVYASGMAGCVAGSLLAGLVLPGVLATDTAFRAAGALLAALGALLWPLRSGAADPSGAADRSDASDVPAWRRAVPVFGVAALAMAVEMAAAKQVAPITGASHVVWGVLFGVFIGGMGAGGWCGGRFADRAAWQRWGWTVYLAAALSVFPYAVWLNHLAGLKFLWLITLPCGWRLPAHFLAAFLPCAFLLGAATTLAVRQALQTPDGRFDRRHAGRYWALASVGNVAGTVAAGFWLIGLVRSAVLLLLCAAGLAALALLSARTCGSEAGRRIAGPVTLLLLACGLYGVLAGPRATLPRWLQPRNITASEHCAIRFDRESRYNRVIVYGDAPDSRVLTIGLDRTPHSTVDVYDPARLYSVYVQMLAGGIETAFPGTGALDALVIGGGGFVLPRWLAATRGGSRILVAEIDPAVTEAATRLLGLDKAEGVVTVNHDGRNVVDRLAREGRRYDVIVGDTVADTAVPYHLVTAEFNARVAGLLKPGGVYLLHLLDRPDRGLLVGSALRTLRGQFRHVEVLRWAGVDDVRGSHVLIASDRALPEGTAAAVRAAHPDFEGRSLTAAERDALCGRPGTVTLTDRFVPVERFVLRDILDNDQLLRSFRARQLLAQAKARPAETFEKALEILRRQSVPQADELAAARLSGDRAGRLEALCAVLAEKARLPSGVLLAKAAYADVLQELKRWGEAGRVCETLARHDPENETHWVRAVNAFRLAGDRAAALNALAAATEHHPRSVALEALRTQLAK